MNQPISEILVTGHSVESYAAVSSGAVFQRNEGNRMLETDELVDTHFSERGRQGRLMMIAMNTGRSSWAFGVDEDTAYIWRPSGVYEIVGEAFRDGIKGGVAVYKDTIGTPEAQSALMHFLTEGDQINPSTGEITWNPDKSPCEQNSGTPGAMFTLKTTDFTPKTTDLLHSKRWILQPLIRSSPVSTIARSQSA